MSLLSERLKELRLENNITQAQLADLIEVGGEKTGKQIISGYERDVSEPDLTTVIKIADYFNVDTDYLLGRTNCRNKRDTNNVKILLDDSADNNISLIPMLEFIYNNFGAILKKILLRKNSGNLLFLLQKILNKTLNIIDYSENVKEDHSFKQYQDETNIQQNIGMSYIELLKSFQGDPTEAPFYLWEKLNFTVGPPYPWDKKVDTSNIEPPYPWDEKDGE